MDSGNFKIIQEEELHAIPLQAKEVYPYLKKFGGDADAKLSLLKNKKYD
jgi:hypothetical protein